ncbi:M20 family metallopeptidase [Paludibaculum fermentans]|uniref:M20 family metallopeptidase n=1 Tax=Paludibaculum fermentans TaxID=1473598 RepID=A0A7S7SHJ7_PALFE|nr:M20 family metallopeptidase [Paludibaculum fermentans]QOY85987.1 M20 family metallopeptidase [Paludibaculum fermentans]
MDSILPHALAQQPAIVNFLKDLVECESPSDDAAAVNRFVDLVAARVEGLARVKTFPGGRFGRNLLLTFDLPGPRKKKPGRILGVGHSDTVWPLGSLKSMPWREADGRLWGPGVLDMKSGLAFFLSAMKLLQALDLPVSRQVALWIVSDEEVGSEVSRPLTENLAKESSAVLVAEPGTGLAGKLKTARKGVGDYTVAVRGMASHAGVDFAAGASAIVELARQIEKIAGFTNLAKGLTVNPGVIAGGTRTNVIAAEARVEVDIRIAKMADYAGLDRKFRGLKPVDKRCSLEVTGGLNRPPMERTKGVAALYKAASELAGKYLGLKLEESATGGGSDGNFTAGLGVPTLDGIGGVGEGAHAANESILVDRIADRTALLALLVRHLGQ